MRKCVTNFYRARLPTLLAAAVWFSFPSIFLLIPAAVIFLSRTIEAKDRRTTRPVVTMTAWWLGSFALAYVLAFRTLSDDAERLAFWADAFPRSPLSLDDMR
jgi:hypothetical protein